MKIKGRIKLEILAEETEKEQVDQLIEELKNNAKLTGCKIEVKKTQVTKEKIR